MALDFPDAPVNGQYYKGFVYNNVPGAWRVTDPIPSVDTPAAVSGTTGSPTVSSGVTIGGFTYDIYTFKTDGTITFSSPGFVDLLCVGGGGGGGRANSSGGSGAGGAGGVIDLSPYVYSGTSQIVVGAGGAERTNGNASVALNFASIGGGAGAAENETPAYDGGSGGGGGTDDSPYAPGSGTIGQGNDGGYGYSGASESQDAAGGGGGAGAVGGAGSNSQGGTGGAGAISTIITTTLATSLAVGEVSGSDVYFGGGGGGGCRPSGGAGGVGGGGAGGSGTGTDGTANTGGGGGGASTSGGTVFGGAGGSGVVIVRVKV